MCMTAAVLAGGTALFSAANTYATSQGAKQQATRSAQISHRNSIYAEQDSQRIQQEGDVEVMEYRRRIAQAKGTAIADAAGSGLVVDTGNADLSNTRHFADIQTEGNYDIAKIRDETMLRRRQVALRRQGFDESSSAYTTQASNYNPLLDASGSLLSSASQSSQSPSVRSGYRDLIG